LKILQVIPRFNPSLGGGVDVVYNLSKHLALRGHEVTVATTDYLFDACYAKELEDLGVQVLPFKHIFNYALFIPAPDMKVWLDSNLKKFDIVHLNGARSYQNSVVLKYAKKYHVPIVLQAHGSIMRIVERKEIKWLYDQVWGRRLYSSTAAVIALSGSEADAYRHMGIADNIIHILPNGVDLTRFENLPLKGEFRRKYSIAPDTKIVLYLGRLHRSKGVDLLVEAFADLATRIDDVRLVLVGPDGGFKDHLEKLVSDLNIEDMVQFTGLVSERDKFAAFIDSDVFVTPKFYGFPITFAESCACGLPIVTTDKGDRLDWINDGVGISTEYDIKKIGDAIYAILTDNDKYLQCRKNCIHIVLNEFNWSAISIKLENIYKHILNKNH